MERPTATKIPASISKRDEPLPELNPWREVGWIFKDGEGTVIERQGDEIRARSVGD
jgi:hypothetical protein